jgi:hypothetical protein
MSTRSQPESGTTKGVARPLCILVLTVLIIAGLGMIAASWIPFSILESKARAMSARGQLEFFDQAFYRGMQFRLRIIGLLNVAIASAGILLRGHTYQLAERISNDMPIFWKDCKAVGPLTPWSDIVGLFLLTCIAAFLRFPYLFQPMRGDETFSFLAYASHPFYVAMSFYNNPNNHIFQSLLMRCSYLLFGNHPWAFRQPVFWAGLCLVPATYLAGRSLYSRESGLLAAGFVASSSYLIEYSTNARGHILTCLDFILLIPVVLYAFRKHNAAAWSLVIILGALGFYTVPLMLYPFGGMVVWLLLSIMTEENTAEKLRSMKEVVITVSLAAFATLELYAPVFAISGPAALLANKLDIPKPLPIFFKAFPGSVVLLTWYRWNTDVPKWLSIALAAGFVLALVFTRRLSKQRIPLVIAVASWSLVFLVLHRVIPPARVWLFALPLYFIVACAGCTWVCMAIFERLHIGRALVGRTIAILAIVVCLFLGIRERRSGSVYLHNEGRGMEEIATFLNGQLKPGDSVVAVVPSDTLMFYHFQQHKVPISYLNAPGGNRVFVVVDEQKGDTLPAVLEIAKRSYLEDQPAKLVARYETACLYEISVRQSASADGS